MPIFQQRWEKTIYCRVSICKPAYICVCSERAIISKKVLTKSVNTRLFRSRKKKNQYIKEKEQEKKKPAAEVGIRGPFTANLIKRKLLSSALSRPGGWVGVLVVHRAGGVHKLLVGWETRWRNAPKVPEDKGWQGTGDTLVQYYRYYHFQYVFISILYLRKWSPPPLTHCNESRLLVLLHFKVVAFYKVEFLIKMSCFCVINYLPSSPLVN